VVIEVDQADGRFQVGNKRQREVMIVTGANEENFRTRIGWQGPGSSMSMRVARPLAKRRAIGA
jgi:hypothetical protein